MASEVQEGLAVQAGPVGSEGPEGSVAQVVLAASEAQADLAASAGRGALVVRAGQATGEPPIVRRDVLAAAGRPPRGEAR